MRAAVAPGRGVVRVLVIEDDDVVAGAIARRISSAIPTADLLYAEALDDAEQLIERQPFDAVVIDLRIPPSKGLKAEVAHGKAVESHIARVQPGAFRLFLTASEAAEVVDALRAGKSGDFLSEGRDFCVVDYLLKDGSDSLDRCVERIVEHHDRLTALDAVPLEGAAGLDLDARRAIAVTVRSLGGVRGRVIVQDGLSQSVTALIECSDEQGAVIGNAFCKSGPPMEIQREQEGYESARYRLASTAMPMLARVLEVGVGMSRALIFTKAPTATTFFDLVSRSPHDAAKVVALLPAVFQPWMTDARTEMFQVEELAEGSISERARNQFAADLDRLLFRDLRGITAQLVVCRQHGDLHGKNLFVTDQQTPFLIDFAHTRVQPGPVDAVSLELSLVFHPGSPIFDDLEVETCNRWFEDEYMSSVPVLGPVAMACREWAAHTGADQAARAVASLQYALWILKHTDRPAHALAIAAASLSALASG
jgi:CheY-like chemotaxis protein